MAAVIENARECAVRLMEEVQKEKVLVPEALARLNYRLSDKDTALVHEVVYGTFRYHPGLDQILHEFCKKPNFPPPVYWLLLTAFYQLLLMRVPDYAVINEAVNLCGRLRFQGLKRVVNGVLRNVQRNRDRLTEALQRMDAVLPSWLEDLISDRYGATGFEAWKQQGTNRKQLSYWAVDGGLQGDEPSPELPHGFRREGALSLQQLQQNRGYIQNETSQAVAELALSLKPGRVLDMCAAPGGKACYMAAFGELEYLLACDLTASRMALLKQNQQRLGLQFETFLGEAETITQEQFGLFDLVLLDAPCTGLGIVGRHPEIKYLRTGSAETGLKETQRRLAEAAWSLVKPGGYVLFTVCSPDPLEVPDAPNEAEQVDVRTLETPLAGFCESWEGGRFFVVPSGVRDGFCGALWRKPSS